MKKITAREAHRIAKKININIDGDGTSFYATDEQETGIWEFDTKTERDEFVRG